MRQLASPLRDGSYDRLAWERAASALAGSLGADAGAALRRAALDPDRTNVELVAIAELLRALDADDEAGPLPQPLRNALLRAMHGVERDPTLASAAARPLAALGEPSDVGLLFELLETGADARTRGLAAWALQVAPTDEVALHVAESIRAGAPATTVDLALTTLGGWATVSAGTRLHPLVRDAAVESLASIVHDPSAPAATRRRAMWTLESVDGARARAACVEVLERAAADGELERRAMAVLADPAHPSGVDTLTDLLLAPATPTERRFRAAEALVREGVVPALPAWKRSAVRQALEAAAAPESPHLLRRRAVQALADLSGRSSRSGAGFLDPRGPDCR